MSHISRRDSRESLAFLISAELLGVLFKFDQFLAVETRLKGCSPLRRQEPARLQLHPRRLGPAEGFEGTLSAAGPFVRRLRQAVEADVGALRRPALQRRAGVRGIQPHSSRQPRRAGFGISPGASTRRRWNRWWREVFSRTARWRDIRRKFADHAGEAPLIRLFKLGCGTGGRLDPTSRIPELLARFRPFG